MKKSILFFAAGTMLLAACSNDDENVGTDNGLVEARITASLSGPVTRAVDTNWNADRIGVMVTNAPNSDMENLYKNVLYTTSSTEARADFIATTGQGIFFQDATETVTFSAYAPYQASAANALPGTDGDGVVTVDTEDNNTATAQESIDFLFASGATATRTNNTVTFADATPETSGDADDHSFHHRMAQLNVVFQTSTTAGFNADDIFDATSFNLGGLKHDGTFNVTNGTATATGEPVESWDITGCKYTDNANTRTYSLILLPQNLGSAPLNVSVVLAGQTYTNTTAINPNLEAGLTYTYTITVTKTGLQVSGCTITNWGNGTTGSGNAEMPTQQ